jgi:hypothetical protein
MYNDYIKLVKRSQAEIAVLSGLSSGHKSLEVLRVGGLPSVDSAAWGRRSSLASLLSCDSAS